MIKKIVPLAILLFVSLQIQAQDKKMDKMGMDAMQQPNKKTSKMIIDSMHQPMMDKPFQKTNNPDLDYLVNMIPHHQGSIDSSEEILKVSKNASVKNLQITLLQLKKKKLQCLIR